MRLRVEKMAFVRPWTPCLLPFLAPHRIWLRAQTHDCVRRKLSPDTSIRYLRYGWCRTALRTRIIKIQIRILLSYVSTLEGHANAQCFSFYHENAPKKSHEQNDPFYTRLLTPRVHFVRPWKLPAMPYPSAEKRWTQKFPVCVTVLETIFT